MQTIKIVFKTAQFFLPVAASSFDMGGYIKNCKFFFSFSCSVCCNALRSLTLDAENNLIASVH